MKKFGKIAGGSSFALALMMGMTSAAEAQTAPAPAPTGAKADKADKDEVVITGSFIRGTPEDAAIPVNAVTLKELQNQGSPSTMDLVKSMTDVGASRGEGDRRGAGSTVGAQTINLRELGSDRTLVLVNGRRLPDQITVGARFNNIAVVPNNVLGRVETLRDGGAVTYGSDAIAGVVNFITRRDFEGFKVRGNYRSIKGTDGDYDADMLWGAKGDDASILLSAQFQHGSTLMAKDRDWAQHLFYQNNDITAWSSTGSPGSFVMNTTTNATTKQLGTAITPGGAGPLGYNTTNAPGAATGGLLRQMSSTGVTRDPGCRPQLDTFNGFLATSPVCYFHIAAYDKLREEKNEYTFYGEVNFSLPVGIKYHGEGSWYRLDLPDVINTPSDTGGPAPQILCTAVGVSTLGPNAACTLKGQYLGALTGIQVPGSNPAVVDILNKLIASNGGQTLSPTQITNITTGGGLSMSSWRPFGTFGNPVFGTYDRQRNNSDQIRLTSEFSGDLPSILGINLDWSAAFTGTHNVQVINGHDILIDRLQSALNGFGGAQCGTLVAGVYTIQPGTLPGVGGCKYLNPFSSAYAVNLNNGARNDDPYNALTNPNPGTYNSGLVNSADLINWLYAPIRYERDYTNVLADLKFTGDFPVELPGGPVAIAFGGQFRFEKDLFTLDDLSNQKISPCTAPRSTVCTDNGATAGSPLFGSRNTGIFGTALETKRQYPAWSAFGEAQLPIFDTLNVDLAARYEKFISDTSDKDNSVVAPQASAKWQATDWLYFRGTIGKTFANVVQPPNDPPVTFLSNAAIAGGSVGTTALPYINKVVPNFDVSPETGLNYSYGAAVKKGPFEAKIDYYSIEIDNLARPAISAANILAGSTTNGLATDSSPVNCDSPLINTLLTQATGAGAAATCSPAAHSGGGPATVTVAQFFTGANRGVI